MVGVVRASMRCLRRGSYERRWFVFLAEYLVVPTVLSFWSWFVLLNWDAAAGRAVVPDALFVVFRTA